LKLELSRFNLNLPKEEFISRMKILQYPKIKEQVFNQKKYGINYNFYLENKSLEIIEEVKFEVLVNLIFDNSEVVFKDYFNKIEIIRPGQSIIINRDLIYNYLSNYKNIYFELHQPQKTILKIKAISFNKVGFKSEVIKEKVIK